MTDFNPCDDERTYDANVAKNPSMTNQPKIQRPVVTMDPAMVQRTGDPGDEEDRVGWQVQHSRAQRA